MEIVSNMKCQLVKISWGIVEIGNTRVYAELWLSTSMMNLKVKFRVPKGMSYSYVCSVKDAPFEDGRFISYWVPKNVYFPVHFCGESINKLVEIVVKHLNLKFFEESRKWLSKEEDEAIRLERKNRSLMDWLRPDHIRAKFQSLADVDDSILWRYVDGSTMWCKWVEDPMNPENVRQRVIEAYGAYQVWKDGDEYHITEWCQGGIHDYPWAIYVGTRSECEAYIHDHCVGR